MGDPWETIWAVALPLEGSVDVIPQEVPASDGLTTIQDV